MALMRSIHIPKAFLQKFPDLTEEKAWALYNRYLNAVRNPLLKRLPFIDEIVLDFPMSNAHYSAGEFQYKNERFYVWKEFYSLQPFFIIIKSGNGYDKQNSRIKLMDQKLIDLLIDSGDVNELIIQFYGEADVNKLVPVKIDINSLQAYIEHTTQELNNPKNQSYIDKLHRNLRQAKYIKLISTFFKDAYGDYTLPHIESPSEYGRMYYKGINMQNISKEVRSAALGDHHVYDLNAAVYAVKLYLAIDILKDKGIDQFGYFTYTKEYLDLKSSIRVQLAKHIRAYPDGMKLIKEAITAIGFGARVGGQAWKQDSNWVVPAINNIIKNKDDRDRFINDPWVKEFVKEQQLMTRFITTEYLAMPSFIEKIKDVKDIKNNNGKFRKTQIMSYLFQHAETFIMEIIKEQTDYVVSIHDAIITRTPIQNQSLIDIKYTLQGVGDFFTISHEFVKGWTKHDDDNESDIDEAFSRLTGVAQHVKPIVKLARNFSKKQAEGYYDSKTVYGKNYYDPDQDDEVRFMSKDEREEYYRLIGYYPQEVSVTIKNLLKTNKG
jgi:hypothetical protein